MTETNKNKRDNIILIGFMGSGKSTIGKKLAKTLEMEYIDTDQLIEQTTGNTIAQLFSEHGEAYFRNLEKTILIQLNDKRNSIISTGGGMPCNPDNLKSLKTMGSVIYLKLGFDNIYKRISGDQNRPLLIEQSKSNLKNLFKKRAQYYLQADFTVMASKPVDRICQRIISLLKKKNKSIN